jgi:hypothetical protein
MPYRQWNGHEISVYWLPDTAAYRPAVSPGGDHNQSQRRQDHEAFVQFMQQRPDPHPVVAPVSGIIRVTFAEEYMRVHLVQSSHVGCTISMRQLRDMNALRERISGASERRLIESVRRRYTYIGNKNLRALGGSRLWKQLWCFAGQCLTALRRRYRPRRMTWERMRVRRNQRREYVALYREEQLAAYAKAATSLGHVSTTVDPQTIVEQALLGELHPALFRHVRGVQQASSGAAARFGFRKFWGEQAENKRSREIREMEGDLSVADVQLYRKIAVMKILEEGIAASQRQSDEDTGFVQQPFPFSWWAQHNRSETLHNDLSHLHRDILDKLHEYEPDLVLKGHVRTHFLAKFSCTVTLTGFNVAGEQLTIDLGSIDTEVKFFGSLVDSSRMSASELTMSLLREDLYARSQGQDGTFTQPVEACIPIFRSIDKLQKGHHRLVFTSVSTSVGPGQGLNTWDKGIFQRDFQLILNSIDISFDCKAYDSLHQLFNDLSNLSRGQWREWDELPERWSRGRRSRGRDLGRAFGQRFARFQRGSSAARSATNIASYDESGDGTSSDAAGVATGVPRSSSLRHIRSVEGRIDSLDEPESGANELQSPNARLLHEVWKHAVARGLTDRDAVRIMLDHLHSHECTAQYYLYMWLQRLRVTRGQVNIWIRELPQFDSQLLEELYSLCSPELIAGDDTAPSQPRISASASIPLSTQHDTVKREGRKLLRCLLNFPKISVSAHINDPQSPTLLIVAEKLECGRSPAQFFSPDFIDKGNTSSYYETIDTKFSRMRAFVAPRDYLYHCMRNRKLNELSILSDCADVKIMLHTLAVPKPIFVSLPREKYSLRFSGLAFVFSYDRLVKFASIISTFMTSSEMLRPKPRDPDDLPGAVIYEYECPFVSIVFAQSKEVSLRVEAEMCTVGMAQPRWVNIEPATAAKSVNLKVRKLVVMVGDPTGIQDGSPTAVAELGGLVYEMGVAHDRKLVIDSLTLSGCRPRSVPILSFAKDAPDIECKMPVILYQQGLESGELVRSLTVAPVEVVYHADVFALLVDFVSSSVGIPEFLKTGPQSAHEVALANTTPAEPTRISLGQDQQVKSRLVLHGICATVVLAQPSSSVSLVIDKIIANVDDGHASICVNRIAMRTGSVSEFFRAECCNSTGSAVELSLGTRDGTDLIELSVQQPWCRIGYAETLAIHGVVAALSKTVARLGARGVDSDLPLRSPFLGVASPSYLASPVPKHNDAPRLTHKTHCQVKINGLKLELHDNGSQGRPLLIEFSASCKHDEFEGEPHQGEEIKGKLTVKGLRVYFEHKTNPTQLLSRQHLCLLQCSLIRPEYTIRQNEKRHLDIVLDREQRSPAVVCQFCNEDVVELIALCRSLYSAMSSPSSGDHASIFRVLPGRPTRPAQRKTELGMDLLFEDLRVYYVTGWADAPLVRMLLKSMNNSPFVYRAGARTEEPRLEAGMEFCIDVLNANISCWEPFLEPVTVQVEHRHVRVGQSKLNISAGMVNVNVTRMFVDMACEVQQQTEKLQAWVDEQTTSSATHTTSTRSYATEDFPLEPALACIVRNETHTDLYFPRHTFRRANNRVATPMNDVREKMRSGVLGDPVGFVPGRFIESRQTHMEEDDDDEGEEHIPGNSAYPERELRLGIVTSDSSRHRPHRIQFRMDGFVPAVVDIEKIGVFPVSLRPKPAASVSSTRTDAEDAKRSISLICNVSVITSGDNRGGKRVVIRSPVVIRNSSARALDIKFGDHKVPGNFEPSDQELPLEILHTAGHFGDGQLMVRPGRAGRVGNLYTWSRRLSGKTLSHMRQGLGQSFQLSCVAIDGSSPDFVISVYAVNKDGQTYIEFLPPLVIENALACDCQVYMRDQTGDNVFAMDVVSGGTSKVHEIDIPSGQNTMVITTAGFTGELRQRGTSWPEIIRLRNREGQSLVLAAEVSDGHGKTASTKVKSGALFVVLFTTHWVLNHASVEIDCVQQGVPDNALTAVAHTNDLASAADVQLQEKSLDPFSLESATKVKGGTKRENVLNAAKLGMFSFLPRSFVGDSDEKYDRTSITNRVSLRCTEPGASTWSEPRTIDIEKHLSLKLPMRSIAGEQYQLCTTVRSVPGRFYRTKLVSFTPCVLLTNRTQGTLMIKDSVTSESSSVVILPSQAAEFHFKYGSDIKSHISVRSVDFEWSRPLKIDHADDFYLFLRRQGGGSGNTIRVTVKVEGATTFVAFQLLDQSCAQLKIENECKPSTLVKFRQYGIFSSPLEVSSRDATLYSWEDPQLAHRLQILVQGTDVSWNVDIDAAKPRMLERCGDYVLHVIDAGGSTFVLRVMDLASSMPVDPGTPISVSSSRANRGLELHSRTVIWDLDLSGVGLSFIDNGGLARDSGNLPRPTQIGTGDAQELIHCCVYSVRLNAIVAAETELEFYADYMQIDNQWDRRLSLQRSIDSNSNRWRDGKYSVILAPTDKDIVPTGDRVPNQPRTRAKSFLHVRVERVHSPGVDCYRNVLVHLTDLTVKLDGNLIERIVGPAELTTSHNKTANDRPRTVWLFRGPAEAKCLDEIVFEERQQLRRFTDAAVAPRRLFIQRMQILPYTVTVSHSGRPSVLATDGFANVPIRFTKYEGRHIHAAAFSLLSKLRALYGRQLALKLPQFIGAASLFGNPAGVVQTFRQELESVVEDSVASLRDFNLLELKNTMITAVRRLFAKVTGGLGSTCHWAAETLNQQTLTANSVIVTNLPPDIQSEELAEIFGTHDAVVVGAIHFKPFGDSRQALARFSAADGMAHALSLDGACLRHKNLSVKPQPRADPPSNPLVGIHHGVAHCLLHLYSGVCSLKASKCLMAPLQGSAAMILQPVSGLFGYYDKLYSVLGRLYPREAYRASRQRIRSPRRFGRHGSIQPLTSGSSLDRDLLHFVEALDELALDGPAAVVHQTRGFALLTTKHALVYVRRQPTLRLEWCIFAPCLLAYDVPTAFVHKQGRSDAKYGSTGSGRSRKSPLTAHPSVDLLCLCPLQLASQGSDTNGRDSKRLRSLSVDFETEAQIGPLLRRLRTWWICSKALPVDNDGNHLATCISPGVITRVPAFKPIGTTIASPIPIQPRRGMGLRTDDGVNNSRPRLIRFHDLQLHGQMSYITY